MSSLNQQLMFLYTLKQSKYIFPPLSSVVSFTYVAEKKQDLLVLIQI